MKKRILTKITHSQLQTEAFAEEIGTTLKGGECIELIADLGGGKTTFTRGLVRGTKSDDHVSSPTFTISKIYEAPQFLIHHFDFYRLNTPGLIAHELSEVAHDPKAVSIIEWGDVVKNSLPKKRVTITITTLDEDSRELTIQLPEEYSYILEGIDV